MYEAVPGATARIVRFVLAWRSTSLSNTACCQSPPHLTLGITLVPEARQPPEKAASPPVRETSPALHPVQGDLAAEPAGPRLASAVLPRVDLVVSAPASIDVEYLSRNSFSASCELARHWPSWTPCAPPTLNHLALARRGCEALSFFRTFSSVFQQNLKTWHVVAHDHGNTLYQPA